MTASGHKRLFARIAAAVSTAASAITTHAALPNVHHTKLHATDHLEEGVDEINHENLLNVTSSTSHSNYVATTGDTMTGDLTMSGAGVDVIIGTSGEGIADSDGTTRLLVHPTGTTTKHRCHVDDSLYVESRLGIGGIQVHSPSPSNIINANDELATPLTAFNVFSNSTSAAGTGEWVGFLGGAVCVGDSNDNSVASLRPRVTYNGNAVQPASGKNLHVIAAARQAGGFGATNMYGIHIENQGVVPSTTNTVYAIFIDGQSNATTNWGIVQSSTANDNAFAGDTRVGSTTAPTSTLDVTGKLKVSAGIELTGVTQPLTLPRLTTTQRDALTAAEGMMVYNTTTTAFEGYNGTVWVAL